MPKVNCQWLACRFLEDGICTKDEITLPEFAEFVSTKEQKSFLLCQNFEWPEVVKCSTLRSE